MLVYQAAVLLLAGMLPLLAQETMRPKDVREIAKAGSASIPQLQELLKNPASEIRLEAVKQINEIGTQRSIDALLVATQDNDPEIQIHAANGLVNFYLPGYLRTGLTGSLRKVGTSIRGKFTDTNDQVIDPYIQVRPEVIAALGKLARGGSRMDVRANAARAIGVLRGKDAVPDLIEATRSKDTDVIYESLVALQKIRDASAAPRISFLLRDFDQRVQLAAIETTGVLQNQEAVPGLIDVLNRTRETKVRRGALTALAMIPLETSREIFARYLNDKDDRMRAAAAEGYARLRNPSDRAMLEKAYQEEGKTSPRLSLAFALVADGKTELSEFSPLQYLINTLNSSSWRGEAFPFLVEVARDAKVRSTLYGPLASGTKEEKLGLIRVMARSGGQDSVEPLKRLQNDPDRDVALEATRAVRTLQTRF